MATDEPEGKLRPKPTLYVMAEQCDECLFSPDRIVSPKRMRDILHDTLRADTHFICHRATLAGDKNVCCRGFFDTYKYASLELRLARMLQIVEFVTEDDLPGLPTRAATQDVQEQQTDAWKDIVWKGGE